MAEFVHLAIFLWICFPPVLLLSPFFAKPSSRNSGQFNLQGRKRGALHRVGWAGPDLDETPLWGHLQAPDLLGSSKSFLCQVPVSRQPGGEAFQIPLNARVVA
ncbi:hypothetical protein B0T26DRAFT_781220 [Lasiosphaeria miniovina]|uniref:Uncharacterized protein n=1 Tax=Lasiosphaeria miniovina TaxID=1954250 RepID=A0AA40ABY1_9PEZI|nr:uncharacterized protein B0T26DRAFT_781220 [Lasiosphaeria miniovina]KAK0713084.1 hypothetical protein B0T26DRAFT_781220 [Lasiosphaeria miniovina]